MNILKIENLTVIREKNLILHEINLQLSAGELLFIMGPNGSGKTTLLKAIIQDIPYQGEVRYFNADGKEVKPCIGYVPQRLDFDPESPVSVLDLFGAGFARLPVWLGYTKNLREKVKRDLARVGGAHLLHRSLGQLSGGELQRILLALALDPLPDLLLLDEPFSAVDQPNSESFYKLVAGLVHEFNITALVVSHDLEISSRYAQKILFLNHSIQALSAPGEILTDDKLRQYKMGKANIMVS